MTFCIGWEASASAQLELFSAGAEAGDNYRLRYSPPFRTTIRPPVELLRLGFEDLAPVRDKLNALVAAVPSAGTRRSPAAAKQDGKSAVEQLDEDSTSVVLEDAKWLGDMLFQLILPPAVQAELRTRDLYVELGVDEKLLEYPWELMYDGEEFLCLKHFLGRFVNVVAPSIPRQRPVEPLTGKLSVLLISVPRPLPRGGHTYEALPSAEAETAAIVEELDPLGDAVDITLLKGSRAKFDDVFKAMRSGRYHIVHFNGHASFDTARPTASKLVLFDSNLTTGQIMGILGNRPPVLFFMNACETAAAAPGIAWERQYDIFGLARAFLETGAYLVGSRWKVGDEAAAAFARAFYKSLVHDSTLGRAVQNARVACKHASDPDDLSWASYLFYGDPRVRFSRIQPAAER